VAKNGDVNSAIKYLNASLESDKRYLQSYVSLASIYESMHFINLPMAIQNRLQIKKYDPYNAQNLVNLENDYILTKNVGAAIAIRDSILEMAPGTDLAKQATILITKIGK
jgi:tetratricopeptide (TPR) repeat protein